MRDPPGAGVDGVLDQLLDDRGGPLDDFARGDLVGEVGRQPMDPGHGYSQPRRRKYTSMAPTLTTMIPMSHQNMVVPPTPKCGRSTFMP